MWASLSLTTARATPKTALAPTSSKNSSTAISRTRPHPLPCCPPAQDAKQMQGLYKVSRRFETNILGITTLLGETKIVADPKDNTIFVPEAFKLPNGQPKHFQEIAPMLFQEVHGQDKIAFVKDSNGQTLAYIDYPFMLFQKIESPFQKNVFNYIIIGFSVAVIVLTI